MDVHTYLRRPGPCWHALYGYNPDIDNPIRYLSSLGYGPNASGFDMPEILNETEARKRVQYLSTSIATLYRSLKTRIEQQKQTILSTWMNELSVADRREIANSAWGSALPENHQPDLHILCQAMSDVTGTGVKLEASGHKPISKKIESFRFPFLNIKDLAIYPSNLTTLLTSRATEDPIAFWRLDLDAAYMGRQIRAVNGPFLARYVVKFNGTSKSEDYESTTGYTYEKGAQNTSSALLSMEALDDNVPVWEMVLREVVVSTIESIEVWKCIKETTTRLRSCADANRGLLDPNGDLPEEMEDECLYSVFLLKRAAVTMLDRLNGGERVLSFPALRRHFIPSSRTDVSITSRKASSFKLKPIGQLKRGQAEVIKILMVMLSPGSTGQRMKGKGKAKSEDTGTTAGARYKETALDLLGPSVIQSLGGAPTKGKFDQATTTDSSQGESELDAFWAGLYEELKGENCLSAYFLDLWDSQIIRRSPKQEQQHEAVSLNFVSDEPKDKKKTRGEASATEAQAACLGRVAEDAADEDDDREAADSDAEDVSESSDEGAEDAAPAVEFKLTPKSMDVADFLFIQQGPAAHRAEIEWRDFLRLIAEMGCRGERPMGASWRFQPMEGSPLYGESGLFLHAPYASQELVSQFNKLLGDASIFGLLVTISAEALTPVTTLPSTSSSDFSANLAQLAPHLQPNEALYIILRRHDSAPHLAAVTYVPDAAKVRQKMLFASTRLTLVRELGSEHFRETIFATTAEELSPAGFDKHDRHTALDAPLTEEERTLGEVKRAEAEAGSGTGVRDLNMSQNMSMPIEADAHQALNDLGREMGRVLVMLKINPDTEIVELVPDSPEPTTIPEALAAISTTEPRFAFFRYQCSRDGVDKNVVLFFFTNPASSGARAIKARMLYPLQKRAVLTTATDECRIKVDVKFEVEEPAEITEESVMSELFPKTETKTAFRRPKRPGR
ncbi:Uu.00g056430.m01.CDS01 [Anthostomella pinea]|uniref:Uu.00g056430.m01.CDS01 n=1 Tax=Anthostomella pinea TaxID=933095 RepID=A0AAI8VRJ5_9PEZI|nr:Uu.00g056430.m01.CDS01 [Anthostomella pinea]